MAWVKMIWDKWNLRVAILVSLFFQILLVFIAPLRKRRGNKIIILLIWGAYLLADWVAVFTIGLVSHNQANNCDNYCVNKDLLAFWAPFLLLHLGGPDTITAFSLEDNGLWIRHFVGLVIQLVIVAYVFLQSFPNQFWIPTVLVFFAGTIKYAERIRAQYLACLDNFHVSMLPFNAALAEDIEFCGMDDEEGQTSLPDIAVLKKGYNFFQIIKRLIVYLRFSFHERHESYRYLSKRSSKDAFRVIEVELNFLYDVLYTKMAVVHCRTGYFLRFIFSFLMVVSFALFATSHHKDQFHHFDIVVTYTLLIGAVGLDLVSLLMLIFSHWTVVLLSNPKAKNVVYAIQERFFSYDKRSQRFNFVPQHSLISYCINIHQRRFKWFDEAVGLFRLNNFLYEIQYIRTQRLEKTDLKDLIFKKLKEKADPRESQDTELSAQDLDWGENGFFHFWIRYSMSKEVEYDRKLFMWHIATEICYLRDEPNTNNREFCKILSEYMLYLLVMQPTMTSTVPGIGQIRIRDMCKEIFKEVKMILDSHTNNSNPPNMYENFKKFFLPRRRKPKTESSLSKDLVSKILDSVLSKRIDRGGESLLCDACMLADDLMNGFESNNRWEIMSNVWLDLLCYVATHCGANAHAEQVSKGGELITSLWLLVSHFGLGEQISASSRLGLGTRISASSRPPTSEESNA
ncbi:hypothetical protein LOK49_LG06G00654 [Camellia lanceoleosa]|uniref:Uncharacterized protein n=1 Tax=Camellia lanceoleosa TaxID=1840588 RepID=A0ACC0HEY9_9ERIC|nr:hypothetical protein LOK49_LG06G00654 [Camellia lanceoleosa]